MNEVNERKLSSNLEYLAKGADVLIYDQSDNLIMTAFAVTEAGYEFSATTNKQYGGKDGLALFAITSEKTGTVNFTTLDVKLEMLALIAGNPIRVGENKLTSSKETVDVDVEDGKRQITLPVAAIAGTVFVNATGEFIKVQGGGTTIDISEIPSEATCVEVMYAYTGVSERVVFDGEANPMTCKVVYDSNLYQGETGAVVASYRPTFPKVQLDFSLSQTFNTTATDANGIAITGEILGAESDVCGDSNLVLGWIDVIRKDPSKVYEVNDIVATPSAVEVEVGGTQDVEVLGVKGSLYESITITSMCAFASEDVETATVDAQTGTITGVASGSTTITVTYEQGGNTHTATIDVTVT